jgi:hypothetical protein
LKFWPDRRYGFSTLDQPGPTIFVPVDCGTKSALIPHRRSAAGSLRAVDGRPRHVATGLEAIDDLA